MTAKDGDGSGSEFNHWLSTLPDDDWTGAINEDEFKDVVELVARCTL